METLGIEITAVRIFPFDTTDVGGHVRAMAEIVVNGCLAIRGFKIVESKNRGLFIGMPARKGKDNRYKETVSILTPDTEKLIRTAILDAYNNYTGPQGQSRSSVETRKEQKRRD